MNEKFIGTGSALVTPFTADNQVDVEALKKLVDFQIDCGVEYLVVLGTTAESATLTLAEKNVVKETIISHNNGRIPLMLGLGGNNTTAIVEEINNTDLSAFDAILSVSPYYNKPSQEGIYQHYKAIAEVCPIDIVLYNVPGRTSSNILPETIVRLAAFDNIIGVKEAAGNMEQALKLIKAVPNDFLVISGDDMIALPMVLAGGAGVISVISQALPTEFSHLIRLGINHRVTDAFDRQYRVQDAIDYIFEEGNPVGVKALLEIIGICSSDVRLPLVKATEELQNKLKQFISTLYVSA